MDVGREKIRTDAADLRIQPGQPKRGTMIHWCDVTSSLQWNLRNDKKFTYCMWDLRSPAALLGGFAKALFYFVRVFFTKRRKGTSYREQCYF
jgi:hypothetical protein